MLVLTRKLLEKIYIGDKICVTVVRLEGGQVRLGIDAPREISVVRAELLGDVPPPKRDRPTESDVEFEGANPERAPLRTRSSEVHGIGIRRRGPSRLGPQRPPSSCGDS